MNKAKIYVGNISYDTTEDNLRDFFEQYGNITDIKLISDYQTGRSKGFGFVTFSSDNEGEAALAGNGAELDGRKLNVNTARDNDRSDRSGGRGGRSGGNRDRY